jgi:hypothetical protein
MLEGWEGCWMLDAGCWMFDCFFERTSNNNRRIASFAKPLRALRSNKIRGFVRLTLLTVPAALAAGMPRCLNRRLHRFMDYADRFLLVMPARALYT